MRAASLLLILAACEQPQGTPFVQASVDAEPRWRVDLNRVRDGVYLPYRPRCTDEVGIGHTVEFRNFLPDVPTNVTGIAGPEPIYSPNLVRPYNFETEGELSYSFWRHTFSAPGVYDWIDTNQGTPGRKIVDPYYGTETFLGLDPNTPIGTICVKNGDGSGCDAVCCVTDDQCARGSRCFKSELESVGRCLTPSSG